MNPIAQLMSGMIAQQQMPPLNQTMPSYGGPQFQNPIQKALYILQAMRNPAAFVKQQFPDVPDDISGDSYKTLEYLQKTRGITNDQIRQLTNNYPIK